MLWYILLVTIMHRHTLAQSVHYRVEHEFEVVSLQDSRKGRWTVIGDFYGDPDAAIIDQQEQWVVMVGYGLIIYYLREPFLPYKYDLHNNQWVEMFRNPKDIWWIEAVHQVSEDEVKLSVDPNSEQAGHYLLNMQNLSVSPI